ncbi:hypothetical protein D3C72_1487600 [compost metagenome]
MHHRPGGLPEGAAALFPDLTNPRVLLPLKRGRLLMQRSETASNLLGGPRNLILQDDLGFGENHGLELRLDALRQTPNLKTDLREIVAVAPVVRFEHAQIARRRWQLQIRQPLAEPFHRALSRNGGRLVSDGDDDLRRGRFRS